MNVSFTPPTIFYVERRMDELSWAQEQADRARFLKKMILLLNPVLKNKIKHLADCMHYDHTECNLLEHIK